MDYKLDYYEFDQFEVRLKTLLDEWREALKKISGSSDALMGSSSISGEGADNIKAYITSVHGSILAMLSEVLSIHFGNFMIYKREYHSEIDTALDATISSKRIADIKADLETERKKAIYIDEAAHDALHKIRDIFTLNFRDVSYVDAAHRVITEKLKALDDHICQLENTHLSKDFIRTEEMIAKLSGFINEQLSAGRGYKTTFTTETLNSSHVFNELYQCHLAINKELSEKQAAIETALKDDEQRGIELQKAYEERQKKATITKWVVTGVCVIGSVVAIAATGGAATPLVIGAVSGISGAIMGGAGNLADQYAEKGYGRFDLASLGKDAAIGGVSGFITGYVGGIVTGKVTSFLSNTKAGTVLLQSSNIWVRTGTGASIGSLTEAASGVVTRGVGAFITSGGDFEVAKEAATDKKEIFRDVVIGGISGGKGEFQKYRNEKLFDNTKPFTTQPWDENGKLKPNVRYQAGKGKYLYETNADGDIVCARADKLKMKPSGTERERHEQNTPGKLENDDASHVFGDKFYGSPKNDNMVSENWQLNQKEYRAQEREWQKLIENGHDVGVEQTFYYKEGENRPYMREVNYTVDGRAERSVSFINKILKTRPQQKTK